jgi:hypothetical protein
MSELACVFCIYEQGRNVPAITVVGGNATCDRHATRPQPDVIDLRDNPEGYGPS